MMRQGPPRATRRRASHNQLRQQPLRRLRQLADDNARLAQQERQRRRELEALQRVITAIGGDLNLDRALQTVVVEAAQVFDADASALFLWDASGEQLEVRAAEGLRVESIAGWRAPRAQVELALAANPGRAKAIDDITRHPIPALPSPFASGLGSVLFGRLYDGDSYLGTLAVWTRARRAFDEADLSLIQVLTQYLTIAIHAASRYRAEQLMLRDAEASYNELRESLNAIEAMQEQLIRAAQLRALGEVASGVAHDFNNLLTSILGTCQLLALKEERPDRRQLLEIIELAALDGAETVRRIQEFARSHREARHTAVDISDVVRGALEITRPRWRDAALLKHGPVQVAWSSYATRPVLGNAAELRELLVNLILNAVDAMPDGGQLSIESFDEDSGSAAGVLLQVSDSGVGISAEAQQRIFEPFFSTKDAGRGSGLGLAVCRQIVLRHNGRIGVESLPGYGASFQIWLPASEADQTLPPAPAPRAPTPECRILIVDDDRTVCQIFRLTLEHAGHVVDVARDATSALALFEVGRYHMVVVDLGLRDMSGIELIGSLRGRDPRCRFALVTGWEQQLGEHELHALGIDAALIKPVDRLNLLDTLHRLVTGHAGT
jgi:signal transduction histidine kinase/CheY-like chemotaxis protein